MELTNSLRKIIGQLDEARIRRREGLFKAEGTKCVSDTLGAFELVALIATAAWEENNPELVKASGGVVRATARDLERMSAMSTASDVIAVYRLPDSENRKIPTGRLVIALDGVQDPGNLGTIVRTADWYGVEDVVLSADCADPFSPKAVMATMGSISRVRVWRTDLVKALEEYRGAVIGTALEGSDIYDAVLPKDGVIVMGSEGHGLSTPVRRLVNKLVKIPSYPPDRVGGESLNVGIATAIVLAEFRRRLK